MVCFKELMHVLDKPDGKTRTKQDILAFTEALLAPASVDESGMADFQAMEDRYALYRALAVVVPPVARAEAVEQMQKEKKSLEDIADWLSLPTTFVRTVLNDAWPQARNEILDI